MRLPRLHGTIARSSQRSQPKRSRRDRRAPLPRLPNPLQNARIRTPAKTLPTRFQNAQG